jgi:hypothetical protein
MASDLAQDTRWVASVALVVPVELAEAAAQIGASLSGNIADAHGERFYARRLRAVGGGEVTHRLAHTRIRGAVLALLPELELALPGAVWWITEWAREDRPPREVTSVAEGLRALGLEWAEEEEDDD